MMHANEHWISAAWLIVLLSLAVDANCQQTTPQNWDTQPLDLPFTSPDQALSSLELPEVLNATLFAAEPDVRQPIAITTDERGRLWVVECLTYADGKTNYDMSLKDRILIFEDQDNDGKFDKRTVFWDQGEKLTGIELGFGGVWLTSAPNFLFIADRDQNDVPDGPPEVLLNGFEDDVIRHNIVNGLRWGPDGWLYGRHGIQATSFVGPPSATESQRIAMNCCIWRFHPSHRKLEVVAQGGTNPWGFDYDQHGEMFMINTVIGHLFHVVPNARYRRMYGAHFEPHTYQVMEQTADHLHFADGEDWGHVNKHGISKATDLAGGGHAHTGLMIYQGDDWPDEYRHDLYTANFHGRRINRESIRRKGNGFVGEHRPDFIQTSDPWFRGIEMVYGPDGGVFLVDWSDIGECHEQDGIHRSSGRIFKIIHQQRPPFRHLNLADSSPLQLVSYMYHKNDWFPRKARRMLQQRAVNLEDLQIASSALKQLMRSTDLETVPRLRAMWALYSMGQLSSRDLLRLSRDSDEPIRVWSVRLMLDGLLPVNEQVFERLLQMANDDPSGLVRLYLACGLPRISANQTFQMVAALSGHEGDAQDPFQSRLIWYGIQPHVADYPEPSVELALATRFENLTRNIARRLAFSNESRACRQAVSRLASTASASKLETILEGMELGLTGQVNLQQIPGWEPIRSNIPAAETETIRVANRIGALFGNTQSLEQLREIAKDGSLDPITRRSAIQSVARTRPSDLFEFLNNLIGDKSVSTQVVRSFALCQNPESAKTIISRFGNLDVAGQGSAIETLVVRPGWAKQLLTAVQNGKIPKPMVKAWHARKIKLFDDTELNTQLQQVWGTYRQTDISRQEQIDSVRILADESKIQAANLESGRKLFEQHCANCHVLAGRGSQIGPDLTGSDRQNLNYLLENIIDPSASVAEAYQMQVFQLEDGRVLSGLVKSQNEKILQLQTPDEVVTISRDMIENSRKSQLSLMPDGLLDPLTDQQRIELLAYLMRK